MYTNGELLDVRTAETIITYNPAFNTVNDV